MDERAVELHRDPDARRVVPRGRVSGQEAYETRVADVSTIYTGSTAARTRLLDAYDVAFVYVGPNERALYGEVSFAGIDGLSIAFENGAVTIYAVE